LNHQGHQVHQARRKTKKFKKVVNPSFALDFLGVLGALGGSMDFVGGFGLQVNEITSNILFSRNDTGTMGMILGNGTP
jgi:hypothetical protein